MKSRFAMGTALFVAASMMAPMAMGQNGENTKRLDSQESAFLRQAAQEDVFMERLGQYAADHAATVEVRKLGKDLARDHHADLATIEQMAKDHGLNMMTHDIEITPQQQTIYGRLTAKAGDDFDKDYTKLLVADHQHELNMYKRERDHANDVAVREYAGNAVGPLQHHLDQSEAAQKVAWGH